MMAARNCLSYIIEQAMELPVTQLCQEVMWAALASTDQGPYKMAKSTPCKFFFWGKAVERPTVSSSIQGLPRVRNLLPEGRKPGRGELLMSRKSCLVLVRQGLRQMRLAPHAAQPQTRASAFHCGNSEQVNCVSNVDSVIMIVL